MTEDTSAQNMPSDLEYAQQSLNVLEWGREKFKDVPYKDKGVNFDDLFIRFVNNYYMRALMDGSLRTVRQNPCRPCGMARANGAAG